MGCGDRCPRGPTTTCWCPGDVVGQSTCGEDGLYLACACPASSSSPMLVAPPPPPSSAPALQPAPPPSGVAPPPSSEAPTAARDAEIAAWIAGPVRGHDNRMAAMRRVTIRGTEGAYTITIDNQFGFRCALDFDALGTPSALRDCRSREPDWHARPDTIPLTCAIDGSDLECQGSYQLGAQGGYSSREILLFRRHVI